MLSFYYVTLGVAFSSIVYELLLAQCLSLIWGSTVTVYTLTIGLYIFGLGAGAFFLYLAPPKNPARVLVRTEATLALLGAALPFLIFGSSFARGAAFDVVALALILGVGLLSGVEIPLLMGLAQDGRGAQRVLAVDYGGTFIGAAAFPFLYSALGVVACAGVAAAVNGAAALVLWVRLRRESGQGLYVLGVAACAFVMACLCVALESPLRGVLAGAYYLSGAR